MSEEEDISPKKGPTRRVEPDEEALFLAKYLTTRGIAWRKPQGGNGPPKDFFPQIKGMCIVRGRLAICSWRPPSLDGL